jgi:anaerobic magnesium-protoporphyrin IX monomethyl ester cyclase
MKILLVNPPRKNEIMCNNPSIIEEERGINPPLGLLYIAACVEKYTDHTVAVIDSQVQGFDYETLKIKISGFNPDVVGLTAMTMTIIDVIKTVNIIKEINANIKVVLGGAHVNLFPEETINPGNIDFLVLGEGEETFIDLLNFIHDKKRLKNVPGLVFNYNGEIVNTGYRPLIKNLDSIPFPSRHLVPYKKYNSILSPDKVVTTIFTSRGCPFKCSFCDRPHLGKIFRARSAANIVDELEECSNMGIQDFLFYDDTFCVDKKRVIDVCNGIIKRKLNIAWDIRTRVDTVDENIIKHLKMANCRGIHYGIEAGAEKVLKALNKGITIKQAKQVFDLTEKYKIPILAYFMIGNPTETLDDIHTTFEVMKYLNPDYAHITIFTPFPGTKIYFDGLEKGVIKNDFWREFAKNPTPEFIPPHWNEFFTKEELNELLIRGYKFFYVRLSYILKRLTMLKSFAEFKKKAKVGIKVAFMRQ